MMEGPKIVLTFRLIMLLFLVVIGVGAAAEQNPNELWTRVREVLPGLWLLSFAFMCTVGLLFKLEGDPTRRTITSATWIVVFGEVAFGLIAVALTESLDSQLLAFLLLGIVIASSRDPWAGLLIGTMAAGGFAYLARTHHLQELPMVITVAGLLITTGSLSGYLSRASDRERELHAEQTQHLRQEVATLGEHLHNVLSGVASGVLVVDGEGKIATYNRAAERILGVQEHQVVGRAAQSVAPLASFLEVLEAPKKSAEDSSSGSSPRRDLPFDRPDGRTIRLGYAVTPLENVAGQRLGRIVVFQDVTLIRDYEARMLAQEQLAALGRMMSGIAHEFGNILGGARGLVDLAMQDEPAEAVKVLPVVSETLSRALTTVDNLLRFARGTPLNRVPGVELDAVLERAIHLLTSDLEEHRVAIERKWEPVQAIEADAVQLEQVFINIIINAIHALQGGEARNLRISLSEVGEQARVRFEDSGPGIDPKRAQRIFEPFFTTKGSLGGSDIPGTGLGLSIALGVIQAHQGSVKLDRSPYLGGACFTVTLPLRAQSTSGEGAR